MNDLSYYKGRLYLYYGVTPAIMLFWPYVAVTGHYLFHRQAVLIFCTVGFLASVGLLGALWRRYFPEVRVAVVAACALALGLATGVPEQLSQPDFYEVAQSCGYMLMILALGAIWRALHESGGKKCRWLAAASVAYGLAVGARPSLLFGAVILVVPVVQAWCERRQNWALLVAAVTPILLIGLGLMLYNARRFDNPFEFGVHYQVNWHQPGTSQKFSLHYLWINLRIYFLEPVRWSAPFPFVHETAVTHLPPGHDPVGRPFGILPNIPLAWLALAVPLAWRSQSGPAASILRWFVTAVTLLFGICALTLLFFQNTSFRYELDFLPALLLLAVVGIFGLEHALAGRLVQLRAARWGWGLLLGFSVVFNLLASVEHYAEVYNIRGLDLAYMGRVPEAIAQFERALQIKPDYAEAHYNLGITLGRTGKLSEAIAQFERALQIKPDYAEAHYNLGIALGRTGKLSEAIAQFEQALQIKPDYADVQNKLAWLLATCSDLSNPSRAVTLAERACQLTTNRAAANLDTLAASYAATGRFDDAVATARQAIELARADGQTQLVSEVESRLGLYRNGHAYRESVGAAPPQNP
jgi:tetratricopeptide (TPR) repeat protein